MDYDPITERALLIKVTCNYNPKNKFATTFPNCLDAYWLAMIIPLPDLRESKGCVVQGSTQLHAGEDVRFKEEGVGINSEPQVPCGD